MGDKKTVVSLFTGLGGLDLGFEKEGFKILFANENDLTIAESYKANHPHTKIDTRSVTEISVEDIISQIGVKPAVVIGGPPCQPFSTAGKRKGLNDPRGSLFMDFVRIVDGVDPEFFLMENVKGILSSRLKHVAYGTERERQLNEQEKKGSVFREILNIWKEKGYYVDYVLLDSAHYGVPQKRERVFIIGSRTRRNFDLRDWLPDHKGFVSATEERFEYKKATLRDAIGDLQSKVREFVRFSKKTIDVMKLIPEGGSWRDLPVEIQKEVMGNGYHSEGGRTGYFRRLAWDRPAPTMLTSPAQKSTLLCHPVETRPLSVEEYKRLQQLPDDYIVLGTLAQKYKMIGNAVPVGLARIVAQAIIRLLERYPYKNDESKETGVSSQISLFGELIRHE